MIAELAAANAAFDVIKQTLQNGREIYEAGDALATYFGLKTEIQKKAHQHGYKSDIAAFMAAEQLAAKENELREMMIYQGRGGMWDDWLSFQAEMKRSREEAELEERRAKHRRKTRIINFFMYTLYTAIGIMVVSSAVFVTMAIVRYS
jgi:molecular chaperone GrpE (heat shock protein)